MSAERLEYYLNQIRFFAYINKHLKRRLHIEIAEQKPYSFTVKMSVPTQNKFGSEIFHRDMDDDTLQAKFNKIEKIYKQYE